MKDLEERIKQIAHWMFESKYLVVFTGAGISTESGLPDFRGPDGIWTRQEEGLPSKTRPEMTGEVLPRAVKKLKELMKN